MVHFKFLTLAAILACTSVLSAPLAARSNEPELLVARHGNNTHVTAQGVVANGTDITSSNITSTANTTTTSDSNKAGHKGAKVKGGTKGSKAKQGLAAAKGKAEHKHKGTGAGAKGNSTTSTTTTGTGGTNTTSTVDTNSTTTIDTNSTTLSDGLTGNATSDVAARALSAREILRGATRVARVARMVDAALGLSEQQPKRRLVPVPIWEKDGWVDRDAE